MLASLKTFSLVGIEAVPVEVEADVSPSGLPKMVMVGLPEATVKESTHRMERAVANSGFTVPKTRSVINLAPAELPKNAASFDLPITLGILAASGQFESDILKSYAVVGELALDGATRPIRGALSMAMSAAKQNGLRGMLVSSESAAEAAVVEDVEIIAISSLSQAVGFLSGQIEIEPTPSKLVDLFREFSEYDVDFSDVRGQKMAKRALTVAAAGGHNLQCYVLFNQYCFSELPCVQPTIYQRQATQNATLFFFDCQPGQVHYPTRSCHPVQHRPLHPF